GLESRARRVSARASELGAARARRVQLATLVETRADVDDADRRARVADRVAQHLVVAETVLDGDRDAVAGQQAPRDVRRPCGAVRLHADDRDVDRPLVGAQRRARPIDEHEVRAATEGALDDVADRAIPDDRRAQGYTAFGRAGPCRSAASSVSFMVKLCSASGNVPSRTSRSNSRSASTTAL